MGLEDKEHTALGCPVFLTTNIASPAFWGMWSNTASLDETNHRHVDTNYVHGTLSVAKSTQTHSYQLQLLTSCALISARVSNIAQQNSCGSLPSC